MSSKLSRILDNIPEVGRYVLVAATIVFVSFLFPDTVKFKYNYSQGQTWAYSDLEAPFDFPIKKSDEEIESEIEKLKENFRPFYILDPDVRLRNVVKFQSLVNQALLKPEVDSQFLQIIKASDQYTAFGERLLDQIYTTGIIRPEPGHVVQGADFKLDVISNNTVETKIAGDLYNRRTATGVIIDSLSASSLATFQVFTQSLLESIEPNIIFNDSITKARYDDALVNNITYSRGMVPKGTVLVTRGGIVTDTVYTQLRSLEEEYLKRVSKNKNSLLIFIGYLILTSIIIGVFVAFLRLNAKPVFKSFRQLSFMLFWIIIYSYIVHLIVKTEILNLYVLPFCIVPIVIKNFFNARLALFIHVVIVLIASFLSPLGYEFTFVQILAGIVAVLVNVKTRHTSSFFFSIFLLFLVYNITFLGLSLIREGNLDGLELPIHMWLSLNVFLTLLSYPLIPLMEKFFGFTSDITLVELSDLDKPLLRKISIEAPGTLQHSLQVANLSEAAATAIGANSLLVKVGALYHDVGKVKAPLNFIENQNGNSPHENYTNFESAKYIIEHVTEGVKMGRKAGLPKIIINFILTHHGTTRVEYFYRRQLEAQAEGQALDEELFRYSGPKPRSKEETILMIADSLEAASKSLHSPTSESIDDLTEKIVAGKIAHDQFSDSQLTFEELQICKKVFKKLLKSIYHVRIEYPEEQKAEEEKVKSN